MSIGFALSQCKKASSFLNHFEGSHTYAVTVYPYFGTDEIQIKTIGSLGCEGAISSATLMNKIIEVFGNLDEESYQEVERRAKSLATIFEDKIFKPLVKQINDPNRFYQMSCYHSINYFSSQTGPCEYEEVLALMRNPARASCNENNWVLIADGKK